MANGVLGLEGGFSPSSWSATAMCSRAPAPVPRSRRSARRRRQEEPRQTLPSPIRRETHRSPHAARDRAQVAARCRAEPEFRELIELMEIHDERGPDGFDAWFRDVHEAARMRRKDFRAVKGGPAEDSA